jgi:flavin-dependent dehydrogenase
MLDVLDGAGRRAMLNEVKRYELFANGRVATVSLGRPDLVIDRSVLAGELGKLAEGAGARVVPGRRFLGLRALLRAGLSRSAPATGESRPTVP